MSFLLRYATPFITGFFMISLVSGVALFFHVGNAYFHSMHEILSMVLIAPFVLHLVKNWKPLVMYFKRSPMIIALALSLVIAGAFAWTGAQSSAGGNPMMAMANRVEKAPIAVVAPLYGMPADVLKDGLVKAGLTVATTDNSLSDVAKASGKDIFEVVAAVNSLKK